MTLLKRIDPGACGCDASGHLVAVDGALALIDRHARPVPGCEGIPLSQAAGRILAAPVRARTASPPFDSAAMDGFAVHSAGAAANGPWTYTVAARAAAGTARPAAIAAGGACRILTGAPMPPGTDAVVRQEDTRRLGDLVSLARAPVPGLNVRRAGEDMQAGQSVAAAGLRLGPRQIAACAAAGAATVRVRRALRVALAVTGDEVRPSGAGRHAGQIWDVNTPMLCAALTGPGIDLVAVRQVGDTRGALQHVLADLAARADLVVTTGGVSVGDEDHARPAFAALGGTLHFAGVAMKPGKPVAFGRLGAAFWLGLPGNPLAALVGWQLFGTAVLRRLAGETPPPALRRHVVTAAPIHRPPGRCEFRPASVIGFDALGREVVRCDTATHSGRVANLPDADGLICLPAECDALPAGALVEFLPFPGD